MLGKYFLKIEDSIEGLVNLHQESRLARRDINDLHTIMMLRDISSKIAKKNRIIFIGTGQINENVVHAYIHFQKALTNGDISFDGDILFVAKTKTDYQFIKNFGYPCELWDYQPKLAYYLLEATVVVLSSHLYSFWGDCLLTHCLSAAKKIQLWHGLPAKNIGAGCIDNNMEFHFFSRLLDDCINTDYVCIQNSNEDVKKAYRDAFPISKQYITGDIRNAIIFDKEFKKEFISHKENSDISDWLSKNQDHLKVLYTPTYRESPKSIINHYSKLISLLNDCGNNNIKIAVKLHIGIILTDSQKKELLNICNKFSHLLIDSFDEVYSVFDDFDAMITDYSSIRIDFALTGKPVFLWQFDKDTYFRQTDIVSSFIELDKLSYHLDKDLDVDKFVSLLTEDSLKIEREQFVKNELSAFSNLDTIKKTLQVILNVANS